MGTARTTLITAVVASLFVACELYEQPGHDELVVVESFMIAGEPLPQVRLSTSLPFEERFRFSRQAVKGASVTINLLGAGGEIEKVHFYREKSAGVYVPEEELEIAIPLRSYKFRAVLPETGEEIVAQTTVPDTFSVLHVSAATIVYQSSERLVMGITRSHYPGRQGLYIVTVTALDPENFGLTPFFKDLPDNPQKWVVTESQIVNESSFPSLSDGILGFPLPWAAIAYYGPSRVTLFAIDDNVYDFWRSAAVQQLGSTLSLGEIPNVIDHVDGGIGLFGALAKVSIDIYVQEP